MVRNEAADASARPGGGRVAPHNLQAEESLLGAMLLARDAIAAASEIARPEHFYKPAHGHIYHAILGLYGSGEPVDPITVADELARDGLLDTVGGPAALIGLQANAPAISNAGRYARIIEELAVLRRMIGVAGEIAELGYSMPDDVAKAVDSAESMVFDLAQHRNDGTTATFASCSSRASTGSSSSTTGASRSPAPRPVTSTSTSCSRVCSPLPSSSSAPGRPWARPSPSTPPCPRPRGGRRWARWRWATRCSTSRAVPAGSPTSLRSSGIATASRCKFDDGSLLVADADHQWFAYDLRGLEVAYASGPGA